MRIPAAAAFVFVALAASPIAAQERGRYGERAQGVPPGHLPPPGECRVWYDNRPPGRQPPPTSCRTAERVASRDRYARVIYGGDEYRRDDGWRDRDDRRRDGGRAVPRGRYPDRYPSTYPNRYPYPGGPDRYPTAGGRYGYGSVPFENGYRDGYDKGREDAEDRDSYDPVRHSRYRSADRGYNRRHGTKDDYKYVYRQGFQAGYDDGYRGLRGPLQRRSGGLPWPF